MQYSRQMITQVSQGKLIENRNLLGHLVNKFLCSAKIYITMKQHMNNLLQQMNKQINVSSYKLICVRENGKRLKYAFLFLLLLHILFFVSFFSVAIEPFSWITTYLVYHLLYHLVCGKNNSNDKR